MLKVLISDLLKKKFIEIRNQCKINNFFLQKTGFLKNQCNLTACSLLTFFCREFFCKNNFPTKILQESRGTVPLKGLITFQLIRGTVPLNASITFQLILSSSL